MLNGRKQSASGFGFFRNAQQISLAAMFSFILLGFVLIASPNAKRVDDKDITIAIESDLWTDNAVDGNTISISTHDGIVTLNGISRSLLAKERASAIAAATVGVRSVVNRIKVSPGVDRTDKELQRAVKRALLEDPATESYEIGVTANDGVVNLTGATDSWQEKQLCVAVTKGVRGVLDIENDIVINIKTDRPDSEIKPEIKRRLLNDVRVDGRLIEVNVDDGKVTLSGSVGSLTEKRRAVSDAWVGGVKSVNGEKLEIRWWARDDMRRKTYYSSVSDEDIKSAVKDAFLYDPRVFSFNPVVAVDNGSVTLTGTVSNLRAKQAAEQDARNTIGVWRVKNYLKVMPKIIPANEELERRVSMAIADNPYVSRLDVSIEVDHGNVKLTGTVNNSFEKMVTGMAAATVKGVTSVANQLDYKYQWSWAPDNEIREDVRDELFWSPFVDEENVTVEVERGIVDLEGNVQTWAERYNAEQCAWEAGAKDVRNNLTTTYEFYGPYPPMLPFLAPDRTISNPSVRN